MSATPAHEWFDYPQAAAYLGITVRALRRRVEKRTIGFTRFGSAGPRSTQFSRAQLDAYIESCTFDPER